MISRRRMIAGLGAGAGGLMLSGCEGLTESPGLVRMLGSAEKLTYNAQRLIVDRSALAEEFGRADLSPVFRANGNRMPASPDYARHLASNFGDWRLMVDGLVARPLALSLAEIKAMPQRTQITRHDCVEGWSAIGEWTGVPLGLILKRAGLRPQARFIVFHCADDFGGAPYYESVDLIDAFHPQTIMAWALNDAPVPVANGAPIRARIERQLGYKHAKYVMRVEAVVSLAGLHGGKGGFWEDRANYEWYAGI